MISFIFTFNLSAFLIYIFSVLLFLGLGYLYFENSQRK